MENGNVMLFLGANGNVFKIGLLGGKIREDRIRFGGGQSEVNQRLANGLCVAERLGAEEIDIRANAARKGKARRSIRTFV